MIYLTPYSYSIQKQGLNDKETARFLYINSDLHSSGTWIV